MNTTKIEPQVKGRIFIRGALLNVSPLAVSNGDSEYSDADIYRSDDGKPVIPGTSFMGALKNLLKQIGQDNHSAYRYLFGYTEKSGKDDVQSHFIIDDLKCISNIVNTNVRDGVKIDPKTNLAVDKGKYDYEILEPGHTFSFDAEITVREGVNEVDIDELLSIFSTVLKKDYLFQVGSLTSFGFGQMKVEELKRTPLLTGEAYFHFLEGNNTAVWEDLGHLDEDFDNVLASFDLELIPTTPLFIGGGKINVPDADDASLKSNDRYILSAKSLKGAVRHQAYRIANTVHGEQIAEEICDVIFGKRDKKDATKSAFWTSDAIIEKPGEVKAQMRVAIDRFTGGAIESALFATEPVWPSQDTKIRVKWRLAGINENASDSAIGLLLLVARDLITEMLPIGGDKAIGRGRFIGRLRVKNIEKPAYQKYIDAFLNYKNEPR